MLHLALFIVVRPAPGGGLAGALVPPNTHYLAKAPGALPNDGTDARVIWSPLLFSLPSEMGFSRDLLKDDLRTRLTFTRQVAAESFLEAEPGSTVDGAQVLPQELMLTGFEPPAPPLPANEFQPLGKRLSARRVYVAPELKERLVGGVVLPPELNQEVEAAWEVHAAVSISGQGTVRHVFLDQPLESAELNSQVLRLLYGLRFKPGEAPVDGRIEIYSPETTGNGGVEP